MPWTPRKVAEETPSSAPLRMPSSQRDFAVRPRTWAANRLRAVLLEASPAFEAAELRRFRSVAERASGAGRAASDRLWTAAPARASSDRPDLAAGSELLRLLAAWVVADAAEVARLDALVSDSLAATRHTRPCSPCPA